MGKPDQLAYYSNYGPRIDVAAPGGARKFNLPLWDRGGTPGLPYTTADGTAAWEDFSITSNWALQIPCFVFNGGGFSGRRVLHHDPGNLDGDAARVRGAGADRQRQAEPRTRSDRAGQPADQDGRRVKGNTTPGLSATDLSAGDSGGATCTTGYCHLGGPAISDKDAYGAGIVNAATAVKR